ncbi:hypothetical protein Tco_1558517 [Tanacetum coccineum]
MLDWPWEGLNTYAGSKGFLHRMMLGWLYMWVCVSDPGDAFFIAIFPIRDDVDANVIGSGLEGNMFGALRSPRRELRNEPNYVQNGVEMNEIS